MNMLVDRATFLLLAGSIAAGGCVIKTTDDDDDGSGGSGGEVTSSTTSDGGAGGGSAIGGGQSIGGAGGGQGGAGGSEQCDDSVGTVPDCSTLTLPCNFQEGGCSLAELDYKPRVAQNAVDCVGALAGASTCVDVQACQETALASACADATADDDCATLAPACSETEAACHDYLDGLTEDARTRMLTCATEGCVSIRDCAITVGVLTFNF